MGQAGDGAPAHGRPRSPRSRRAFAKAITARSCTKIMDLNLITSNSAEVETECLVAIALDHGEKQKNEARLAANDPALEKAIADFSGSSELTGKSMEAVLLHRPQGLKAKRLLVVGGGKAKSFGAAELRKASGTAIRFLKAKMIKSCALALAELAGTAEDTLRAAVEGAFVADFDPDTYRSERKDSSMKEVAVVPA